MQRELQYLSRFWIWSILLPLPFLLFLHSGEGRSLALNGFFLGCMILVAYSFRRDVVQSGEVKVAPRLWRQRLLPLSVTLFVAFIVFSVICLLVNNPHDFGTPKAIGDQGIWLRAFVFSTPHDFVAPMLALMTLIPVLCIVPYFVLITRKPFAAIVFAALIVGCMKLLGATVVVFVYGWNADAQGRTKMPWNHPDLLVWLFWGFTGLFSLMFYILGVRRFHSLFPESPPNTAGQVGFFEHEALVRGGNGLDVLDEGLRLSAEAPPAAFEAVVVEVGEETILGVGIKAQPGYVGRVSHNEPFSV